MGDKDDESKAAEKLTEDEYDCIARKNYDLGEVATLEQLVATFSERAGLAYARGDDQTAAFYRGLQTEFKLKAKNKRETYMAKYH